MVRLCMCPFCYIGKERLENAMNELGIKEQVNIEMRSFELDPNASYNVISNTEDRFAKKEGNKTIVKDLFKAYFTDNLELSDRKVLKEIAVKNGLDENKVEKVLNSNELKVMYVKMKRRHI